MRNVACDHHAWLHLKGGKSDFGVSYENRFRCVIDQLTTPSSQYPCLAFFLGRKNKDAALRQIFPKNTLKRQRCDQGSVRLDVDTTSLGSKHPILFADADPNLQPNPHDPCRSACHPPRVVSLPWAAAVPHLVQDIILNRLLFLFTDVICLFADDVGGLEGVKTLLTTWADIGSASSLPSAIRPRLLVISREEHSSATYNLLERENFRYDLLHNTGTDLSQTFASIRAIVLPGEHLSPLVRHKRLGDEIYRELDRARKMRTTMSAAFSGTHQSALFNCALLHTSRTRQEPFNLVRAARHGNELGLDYSTHIQHVLSLAKAHGTPLDVVCSFIASSVLMDAYPPRMHRFNPEVLFRTLYFPPIFHGAQQAYEDIADVEKICNSIQNALVPLYNEISQGSQPSSVVHRANLVALKSNWSELRTNRTCLGCLRGKPEHVMPCGHSYCEKCVRIFGQGMLGFEHQYVMHDCVVCQKRSALIVKLKPPTAGIRILSIDGGGTRGVVPLETLSLLQDLAGDYPVQDFFDLAFGTSSGGLIVLSLFIKRWEVQKSIKVFKSLTRRFFGRPCQPSLSVTKRLRQLVKCWLSDGVYDVEALENALKENFGNELCMFGNCSLVPSGSKVAVTATSINDASAFIFANYNGEGLRRRDCGYRLVRPREIEHEARVWQAGRATSAAPVLFRPVQIPLLGAFQDGSLRHNNPAKLALWESRCIWPKVKRPDVVLSLGTGTDISTHSPKVTRLSHIFKDGAAQRLYRWVKSSIDGQRAWCDLKNSLDDEARRDYFRLNVSFPGPEPAIDDIDCMDGLSTRVRTQPQGAWERFEVFSALLISSLFFELEGMPVREGGVYRCNGAIRCRSGSRFLIRALMHVHEGDMEFYKDGESLSCKLEEVDICTVCCRYRCPVEFLVESLKDQIVLSVRGGKCEGRNISAMPNSLDWFINQQSLQSPFGSATHDDPGRILCQACSRNSILHPRDANQGKRKRPNLTLPPMPRKRRLLHKSVEE